MNKMNKALIMVAASAGLTMAITPAHAKHPREHSHKIDAGEVIAGALIVGGIAALVTSGKRKKYDDDYIYHDRRYSRNNRYNEGSYHRSSPTSYGHDRREYDYRIPARRAVRKCIKATKSEARYYGKKPRISEIRSIKRRHNGYIVKGRLNVRKPYHTREAGHYNYRHNNQGHRQGGSRAVRDGGKFSCRIEGRYVTNLKIKGL